MSEVEFRLETDLSVYNTTEIVANFEEMEAALTEMMRPYASMVVTEGSIATAKSDRARIRRVVSHIEDVRKGVKKSYSAPLSTFEYRCKALTDICNAAAGNLDAQIKAYDAASAAEKVERLRTFFLSKIGEAADYLSFEAVNNPRWVNVTYSEEDARSEILAAIGKCRLEVDAIRALASEHEAALLEEYRRTQSLASAMQLNARLCAIRKKEEAMRKVAEGEKAPAPTPSPAPAAEQVAPAAKVQTEDEHLPFEDDFYTLTFDVLRYGKEHKFRIVISPPQWAALKAFFVQNNIKPMGV